MPEKRSFDTEIDGFIPILMVGFWSVWDWNEFLFSLRFHIELNYEESLNETPGDGGFMRDTERNRLESSHFYLSSFIFRNSLAVIPLFFLNTSQKCFKLLKPQSCEISRIVLFVSISILVAS